MLNFRNPRLDAFRNTTPEMHRWGSLMPQLATALRVFSGERASESVSDGISLVAVNNIVDNDIGRSEKGDKSPSDKPSSSDVELAKYLRLTKSGYLPSINSSAAAKARRGSLRASRRRTWSDGLWVAELLISERATSTPFLARVP